MKFEVIGQPYNVALSPRVLMPRLENLAKFSVLVQTTAETPVSRREVLRVQRVARMQVKCKMVKNYVMDK
jgi:hypothetical protein